MLIDLERYLHLNNLYYFIYELMMMMIFLSNLWILKMVQTNDVMTMVTMTTVHNNNNNNNKNNLSIEKLFNNQTPVDLINRSPRYTHTSSSSASTVLFTVQGQELAQLSQNCIVYDETPAEHQLIDETNGNACQLLLLSPPLSRTRGMSLNTDEKLFIHVKLIKTANFMADYFNINANNYTLLTSQHIDREELCNQALLRTDTTSLSDSLRICCMNGRKECIFPLNILVQTRIGKDDVIAMHTTNNVNSNTSSSRNINSTTSSTTASTGSADISSSSSSSSTSSSRSKFFTIQIKLIDINDNPPKFPNTQHTIHVSEGIQIGSRLPLPLAKDLDCTEYNIIRYQLLTQDDDNDGDTFELIQLSNEFITSLPTLVPITSNNQLLYSNFNNLPYQTHNEPTFNYQQQQQQQHQLSTYQNRPEQLYLKVRKKLDWETRRHYKLRLNAEDGGQPAFTGEMSLEVSLN
ncbi:unnamed protein product [Schistosoma turkestanicum]|nr:unnamed protein product [Schistosoma turkestanicum]